ncbi:HIRA [Cordylochernes scorpioides]|uniref:HIRA n=1 Tax=Cordylochernes scorpioides TaxID=51811 RepID=A0ABY6KHD4_9ARAC|nr:HIRA [Cordylochernes scorpioides]
MCWTWRGAPVTTGWPPAVWTTPSLCGTPTSGKVGSGSLADSSPLTGGAGAEIITVLRGHTSLVKGVVWDPIGKYLASQVSLLSCTHLVCGVRKEGVCSLTTNLSECGGPMTGSLNLC